MHMIMSFRYSKIVRYAIWVCTVGVLLLTFGALFLDIVDSQRYKLILVSIITILVLSYSGFDIIQTRYGLRNNALIVTRPFKPEFTHSFNDISRIEESKGPIAYLKIFLLTQNKPIVLPIDNIEEFIFTLLNSVRNNRKITFDDDNKGFNLS